jgi:phosphoribosyl 1,2-cyclic phosphodiesterase
MAEIKFIGTGAALDHDLCNSSALVTLNGKKILIDCGSNVYGYIKKYGLEREMEYVLITHLHDDHIGSLFLLIMDCYYNNTPPVKLKMLVPDKEFGELLFRHLEHSLVTPLSYIDFVSLEGIKGAGFVETTGKHMEGLPSRAYYFEDNEEVIFYSGDIGEVSVARDFLHSLPDGKKLTIFHDTCFGHEKEHVWYRDLEFLLDRCTLYGYHHHHHRMPADNRIPLVALEEKYMYCRD